jgi:hypothetical protein
MARVTVYRFTIYDIFSDDNIISKRMGTREGVEKIRGAVIESTAVYIDEASLDPDMPGLTPIGFAP